jgi:hypothetical protein
MALHIVLDGPPGPGGGRFVEVEDDQGRSAACRWREREDGTWELVIRRGDVPDEAALCECGASLVCMVCDTCAEHCLTDADPDACWQAHKSWRLGGPDLTFDPGAMTRAPRPGIVPAAPKPRWPAKPPPPAAPTSP